MIESKDNSMQAIAENLGRVTARINAAARRSGRKAEDITLVAVSKTVGVSEIEAAKKLGMADFGENRVQDLLAKRSMFPDVKWHMIGHLQTNKVKDVIGAASLIHSLDRWELAEYIEKRAKMEELTVPVLVQVNVSGESSKGGISPLDVEVFLGSLGQMRHIQVKGLMTMAPEVDDALETRPIFKETAAIFRRMSQKKFAGVTMEILSMGMTQDFEIAIEEGANLVRVGQAIFGSNI